MGSDLGCIPVGLDSDLGGIQIQVRKFKSDWGFGLDSESIGFNRCRIEVTGWSALGSGCILSWILSRIGV